MKKLLLVLLSVLLLLPGFVNTARADTYFLTLGQTTQVYLDADNDEGATCWFIPAEDGFYTFYSTGSLDTTVFLYDDGMYIASDFDGGEGENFSLTFWLTANRTYQYDVMCAMNTSGFAVVAIEKTWAGPLEPLIQVYPGQDYNLEVVGDCTLSTATTYEWYCETVSTTGGTNYKEITNAVGSSLLLTGIGYSANYYCVVTEGAKTATVKFEVYVNSGSLYLYINELYPVEYGSDLTVEGIAEAGYPEGLTFLWYDEDETTPFAITEECVYEFKEIKAFRRVTVIMIDQFLNTEPAEFVLYPIHGIDVHAGETWSVELAIDNWYRFVPETTAIYSLESTGSGDPWVAVFEDAEQIAYYNDYNSDKNFSFRLKMQAGHEYLFNVGFPEGEYSDDTTITLKKTSAVVAIQGVDSMPYIKGFVIYWQTDDTISKYQLQRKLHSATSWKTLSSKITDPFYMDETATKMGAVVDFRLRGYKNGAWSKYSEVVTATYSPYWDVVAGHRSFKKIAWAYNNNVVSHDEYYFNPETNCTRAEMAVMLYCFNGKPKVTITKAFTDLDGLTTLEKKAISWCYAKKIVAGSGEDSTKYEPYANVTRAQMAIMLWKMAGKPKVTSTTNPFPDIDDLRPNVKKAILWLISKKITSGKTDPDTGTKYFDPQGPCTREHLVIFLYNYNKNVKKLK